MIFCAFCADGAFGPCAFCAPEAAVDPFSMPAHGANGRWVFIPDDDRPDQPHDDAKDHDPCPECNPNGKGKEPGWYQPLTGPKEHCRWCEGAGWL